MIHIPAASHSETAPMRTRDHNKNDANKTTSSPNRRENSEVTELDSFCPLAAPRNCINKGYGQNRTTGSPDRVHTLKGSNMLCKLDPHIIYIRIESPWKWTPNSPTVYLGEHISLLFSLSYTMVITEKVQAEMVWTCAEEGLWICWTKDVTVKH